MPCYVMLVLEVALWSIFLGTVMGAELSFPPGFKFGAATAAYQVEGAWNVGGKGMSIWDVYTHQNVEKDPAAPTGDMACDSYHNWEKDVEIAANMSLDFYRFSISWSRLLPTGLVHQISEDGKQYYNKLIDRLIEKGIEPVVTLYHWDLPQRLQNLGGWTNPLISDWFADYANLAFSLYADRVKTWLTLNEPIIFCDAAYEQVLDIAPGIYDPYVATYLCTKNALIAHAKAYRAYHKNFGPKYNGKVSFTNQLIWFEGETEADKYLAETVMEYSLKRFLHPVFSKEGGWPPALEKFIAEKSAKEGYLSSRLPAFTPEEIKLVQGTYDFCGVNHYTSRTVRRARPGEKIGGFPINGNKDLEAVFNVRPEWKESTAAWLVQNPEGFRHLLLYIKHFYGDVPIFVMENGYATIGGQINDDSRVEYYYLYLKMMLQAITEDEVNVVGYTAWTLIDNFEWWDGYRTKFGLYEVDFSDPLRTRKPRKSAAYYTQVVRQHALVEPNKLNDELYPLHSGAGNFCPFSVIIIISAIRRPLL